MPNLKPPVTTAAQAAVYKERTLAHIPEGSDFNPLMTYLTDSTSPGIVREAWAAGDVHMLSSCIQQALPRTSMMVSPPWKIFIQPWKP